MSTREHVGSAQSEIDFQNSIAYIKEVSINLCQRSNIACYDPIITCSWRNSAAGERVDSTFPLSFRGPHTVAISGISRALYRTLRSHEIGGGSESKIKIILNTPESDAPNVAILSEHCTLITLDSHCQAIDMLDRGGFSEKADLFQLVGRGFLNVTNAIKTRGQATHGRHRKIS